MLCFDLHKLFVPVGSAIFSPRLKASDSVYLVLRISSVRLDEIIGMFHGMRKSSGKSRVLADSSRWHPVHIRSVMNATRRPRDVKICVNIYFDQNRKVNVTALQFGFVYDPSGSSKME